MKAFMYLWSILITVTFFGSCSDVYDNIKRFSPEEIVYPAGFDTIGWKLGYERVEFDLNKGGRVPSDQMKLGKAKKTVIEYDDERIVIDSVCSWVNISGLNEMRLYHFTIYTEDQYGDKSIPQKVQLTPFTKTDLELLSLVPPNITESTSAAIIEWSVPIESDLYEFFSYTYEYTDKDGQKHSGEGENNLPIFFVENVLLGVEVPVKITAKILPKIGGISLLDTIPAWETSYNLRISEAAKPAIFLKTPLPATIINIKNNEFPVEFSWTKVPEAIGYFLKISRNREFPNDASTKTLDLGDESSYLLTENIANDQIFADFDPINSITTYYWQVAPKEQTSSIRLQTRILNYKIGDLVQEYVDDTDEATIYTGNTTGTIYEDIYYNNTCNVLFNGASLQFTFKGRYIAWHGLYNTDLGRALIYIDDELVADINCYGYRHTEKLFEKLWLSDDTHTIRIEATNGPLVHDYFVYVHDMTKDN
ncbi:MAG: DUF4998 domain-containing protein [Tannerella sp.]|jgi:hypothetical protein|nr:DUF4998 domain-containing protein [Tannerella sp.]